MCAAVIRQRRSADPAAPRCGRCGYDLTGAAANRCPECGALFIEAGVISPRARGRSGRITVILLCAGMLIVAGGLSTLFAARARQMQAMAAARAEAARQAALTRAAQHAATTTAPASHPTAPHRP